MGLADDWWVRKVFTGVPLGVRQLLTHQWVVAHLHPEGNLKCWRALLVGDVFLHLLIKVVFVFAAREDFLKLLSEL